MLLAGKVAVVTGGGQGIGRGYALGLAGHGADVVVADINEERGKAVAGEIGALGRKSLFCRVDVSDAESSKEMARVVGDRFGGLDILVNNAAMFAGLPSASVEEMSEDLWDRVMAVNVKGVWLTIRAVLPLMRKRGGGAIVNQASTASYLNNPTRMHYNVSKAAVVSITKTLAKELAPDKVRVNAISPGPVGTDALKGVPPAALERAIQGQCIKRIGEPEDLVGALVFLVSDMSAWMTGQVVVVDGGGIMLG